MANLLTNADLMRQVNAFDPRERKAVAALFGIEGDDTANDPGRGASPASTIVAAEYGNDTTWRKTVLTVTALAVALSDDAGVAQYGGAKIYDFPLGLIQFGGAVVSGNFTGYASLIDTFASNVAIGTATAGSGLTLTSTEANIMQQTANATAAAEVAAVSASGTATQMAGGHATATDAYLNFTVADDAAHGTGNAAFTGTVTIFWRNLSAL